jgi:putative ABC transport system permease protein
MNFYHLKSAVRNARKNSILSFAKLFGISISFAVILFSASYVYYETSFDKNVPDFERIYRIYMYGSIEGNQVDYAVTSQHMAPYLRQDFTEIEEVVRLLPGGKSPVFYEGHVLGEQPLLFTDSTFFHFFGIPFDSYQVNPLASENNLLISESLAISYFGSIKKAMNKTLTIRGEDCTVTGVFADFPENFHLSYQIILPLERVLTENESWNSQSYYTYIKTHQPLKNLEQFDFRMTQMVYTHSNPTIDGANAKSWSDLKDAEDIFIFYKAQPLHDIHFSNKKFDPAITSNKIYVYGAIILSLLVLVISSLNYVNLTLANLSTRVKEMGIRKTLGAFNGQVAVQFIQESVLFWIVGFLMAVVLYIFAGPFLADYLDFSISLSQQELIKISVTAFLILIAFNLVTIAFPVTRFSRKQVLMLIKPKTSRGHFLSVKSTFVFIQFGISTLIVLTALIVSQQISYLVQKDRGYDPKNVIMLTIWDLSPEKRKTFIESLKAHSAIEQVASSNSYFGEDPAMSAAFFEAMEDQNYFHTSYLEADYNFLQTFNFKLAEGSFFRKDQQTDQEAVVLNEAAAREYAGEGSLIGKDLLLNDKRYRVIGLVKDFNFRSLHHLIQPLVIRLAENSGNVFIRVNTDQIPQALETIREQWSEIGITRPFDYAFHDEVLARHYLQDQKAKKLLLVLSLISLIIACVGLYAISYFIIVRKTKEIGIRKVNGATFGSILLMLNKDFSRWVLLAFVVFSPAAWWLMQKWLQNFAYRTEIHWWIFAVAGLVMLGIALFTVSLQSWKAARRNPVEALRDE